MLINSFINNMNSNVKRMSKYQDQLSTARKIQRPSDDPVGVLSSLQVRTDLSKTAQYNRNVDDGKSWLKHTETSLMEMNDIILRTYELAVQAANDTNSPEEREKISMEVEQLKEQLVEVANTAYAGRYIFGGYNTTMKPFKIRDDGASGEAIFYNGNDLGTISTDDFNEFSKQIIKHEVSQGAYLEISIPGNEIFKSGEDNLFAVFTDFINGLNDSTSSHDFDASIEKLNKYQQHIITIVADVGGRDNRLNLVSNRLANDEFNYTEMKSNIEDIDYAKTITEFLMTENIYRAGLSVGARIIQPTLVDFLR
jgi:flagellar hook-associated protein 3 FlgL